MNMKFIDILKQFINKKRLVFTWVMGILLGIMGLYTTYAINVYLEEGTPIMYDMALNFELSSVLDMQIVVPAGKTKFFDLEIENPYEDDIKYGVAYSMVSPSTLPSGVKIAQNFSSEYSTTGYLYPYDTVSPAIVVENKSSSDLTILFSVIPGYKNGGGLVVPTGKTLVTDTYFGGVTVVTNPSAFTDYQEVEYEYTSPGKTQITLSPGSYDLKVWGAQGGYRSNSTYGGKGGYSYGTLTLDEPTTAYVYVGGSGNTGKTAGGFNGGGIRELFNGGGGASDIRLLRDSLYARVIVAGGGGSDGDDTKTGMYGGGTSGGSTTANYGTGGFGGTLTGVSDSTWQSTGQSSTKFDKDDAYAGFGFGGNGVSRGDGYGGAGGGGWFGGSGSYPDTSGDDDRGGGGGSGWVYTSANEQYTASSYTGGTWLLNSDYYLTNAATVAGNTSFTDFDGSTVTGHAGDGAVRISAFLEIQTVATVKGLTDLFIVQGETADLNEGVSIAKCATGDTECSIISTTVQDTSALPVGTHTIYYIVQGGNGRKYGYPRKIIVNENPALATLARLALDDNVNNTVYTSFTGIATAADTGIFPSEDDIGISYYFRGNVTNNYVKFGKIGSNVYRGEMSSGIINYFSSLSECESDTSYTNCTSMSGTDMYWRIIRINGDGTVRMIYDGTQPYSNSATTKDTFVGISEYNSELGPAGYVGYMYGSTLGESYELENSNDINSTIKEFFEGDGTTTNQGWVKNNLISTGYSKYVTDAIYCNDRTLKSGTGFGDGSTNYAAQGRNWATTVTPTLKCERVADRFTMANSKITTSDLKGTNGKLKYPVGLITVDELTFSGMYKNSNNPSIYLYTDSCFWTMSPHLHSFNYGYNFYSEQGKIVNSTISINNALDVRPVISLRIDALKSGLGTATAPFSIWQYGDVNRDGTLNEDDSQMILKAAAGQITLDAEQFLLAEMDGNGALNANDALRIGRIISGEVLPKTIRDAASN